MDLQRLIVLQTNVFRYLTKHIITACGDKNLVVSPLSIHVVMSLVAAGLNGPANDLHLRLLQSNSTSQLNALFAELVSQVLADGSRFGGPQLSSANGVWFEQSILLEPSFRDILQNVYNASINNVNLWEKFEEVRAEVNTWVEKETKGLIEEMIPPCSVDVVTKLISANAIYFKGLWKDTFDASATVEREFFLMDGTSVEAPFMFSYGMKCIRAFDSLKVLRLPYKQGEDARNFSMYIYLPDAKDGLPSLMQKFLSGSGFIDRHLPSQYVQVNEFRIPKFKIATGFKAEKVDLDEIGSALPFDVGVSGYQEIQIAERDQSVTEIHHKAFIEVNEEGTEAAAAAVTAASVCSRGNEEEKVKVDFVADHPFLFLIREDTTGVVLFLGQLLNPVDLDDE